MLIVGSKAFKYNFPDVERKIGDCDVVAFRQEVESLIDTLKPKNVIDKGSLIRLIDIQMRDSVFSEKNVEILIADDSLALKSYIEYDEASSDLKYCSKEVLFSMKKSHIHFPIHFEKHIKDYCLLKSKLETDSLSEITKIHTKEIELRLGKLKTPSLNKKVSQFFKQSEGFVKSYFIHDDMHRAVAHYNRPLYMDMQKDPTMAKCEKSMWDNFTFENKCKCVLEEAYVIALERKILPAVFGGAKWFSSQQALDWALMRICTTLCSGWFREFATDNYFHIQSHIDKNYVENFLSKYDRKEIERIKR